MQKIDSIQYPSLRDSLFTIHFKLQSSARITCYQHKHTIVHVRISESSFICNQCIFFLCFACILFYKCIIYSATQANPSAAMY